MTTVGLLHPGAMGASIGALLRQAGHDVAWLPAGRSAQTRQRAHAADLRPVADLRTMAGECAIVISVCPPGHAVELAHAMSRERFDGLYVDANAVDPAAAELIREIITATGAAFVDAAIVGPPPDEPGTTRLFLAGIKAEPIATLFAPTALTPIIVGDRVGAASAVKMAYAGWTKASAALLLALRSYARAWDVEEALIAEWHRSLPELAGQSDGTARRIHRKAWRFVDEMRYIADALTQAGLPSGFHTAAAEVYATLAGLKDDPADQNPEKIYDLLRDQLFAEPPNVATTEPPAAGTAGLPGVGTAG